MTRTRMILLSAGLAGTLAAAGCGSPVLSLPADVADEAVALQALGFDTELPAVSPSSSAEPTAKRAALRRYLRRNTLHGEIVLQQRTVVVQRGTVTAVTGTSVSVKSSDGFALTWTLGDKVRVVQDKKKTDAKALKNGAEVGVAGVKDGGTDTARLVVMR